MYTFLKWTSRVDLYLNVYHIPVHVFLQNETTGTLALNGQTENWQANPIVTMLERVTIL